MDPDREPDFDLFWPDLSRILTFFWPDFWPDRIGSGLGFSAGSDRSRIVKLQSHTMKSMKALQQSEKRACLFH